MSGGRFEIFRNVTARYNPMAKDTTCKPPPDVAIRKTIFEKVSVSDWSDKMIVHVPIVVW